jgi:hypothetical protein
MNKSKEKIKNKLEEYGIEIFKEFKHDDEDVIMAEDMTISCRRDEVFVNFHVTTKPSKSARIILILKEIQDCKKVYVGDDFIFDKKGNFIDGEDAHKYYDDFMKQNTISEYMQQQAQIYYMNKMKTYNC